VGAIKELEKRPFNREVAIEIIDTSRNEAEKRLLQALEQVDELRHERSNLFSRVGRFLSRRRDAEKQ
jgi:hypothetical protein